MQRRAVEDGFGIVDYLIGSAIFVLLLAALVFAGTQAGSAMRASASAEAATVAGSTVFDSVETDARSSIAIFTPPTDIAAAPNADGHEVDFYTRDAAGKGIFTAYCFRGASGCQGAQPANSVGLYRYSWGAVHGGSPVTTPLTYTGTVAENVQSLAAQTVPASALLDGSRFPSSATYFSKIGVTSVVDVQRQTGFPGVLGGNPVTVLSVTTAAGTRTIHLLSGSITTHRNIIVATYTPPPNALGIAGGAGGATLTFANPLSPAETTTLTESNYGTRSTNPAQVYTVIGSTCGTGAMYSPGTITPTTDGSGNGTLTIVPAAQVEPSGVTCVVTVADNVGQSQNITVQIGQTYAPQATPGAPGLPGQTVIFTIAEQNYPSLPFSISATGPCGSPTVVGETDNGGNFVEQIQVTYASAGVCTIGGTDAYGQTASGSANVYNGPVYQLAIASGPSPGTVYPGQTSTFSAVANEVQANVPPGTPSSVPVTITGITGPCGSSQVDAQTFALLANSPGTCVATVAADTSGVPSATAANNPQQVTVQIAAAPTPTPTPAPTAPPATATPFAATPTPAPTAGPPTAAPLPAYVCSSQPGGTDLGPDPNGINEDYSSGSPCGGGTLPTPPPATPSPGASPFLPTAPPVTPSPAATPVASGATPPPGCFLDVQGNGVCSTAPTPNLVHCTDNEGAQVRQDLGYVTYYTWIGDPNAQGTGYNSPSYGTTYALIRRNIDNGNCTVESVWDIGEPPAVFFADPGLPAS